MVVLELNESIDRVISTSDAGKETGEKKEITGISVKVLLAAVKVLLLTEAEARLEFEIEKVAFEVPEIPKQNCKLY
jgi:hypothetical protein